MKRNFRNHLRYFWWLYIVAAILITVVWVSAFFIMDKAKNTEKLDITFIGNGLECDKLQEKLEGELPALSKQKLKEISVSSRPDAASYEVVTLLQTSMFGDYDLIIIQKSFIENYNLAVEAYFAEIQNAFIDKYFEGATLYKSGEKVYGVKTGAEFAQVYNGSDEAYIFFAAGSVNSGGVTGRGYERNDAALKAAVYLSEVGNET